MSELVIRPTPREVFFTKDRQVEIFFYTSNIAKYIQARVVLGRAGLLLQHFRSKTEPYAEDYAEGKERLLFRAVAQVLEGGLGSGSLFFVEDTSLRIEAMSSGEADWPGLAVKEWFASATFCELDESLRAKGGDRRAEVRSDIALHVPGLPKPVLFSGTIRGTVAETPPDFEENPQYPWLTPDTFNGWFIPDGAVRRLGEMGLEESWKYDFRTKALESMISRLEEYTAALNLPPQAYFRRQTPDSASQLPLFPGTILIILGQTCAGKTTFGDTAQDMNGLLHIEASAIVRMLQRNTDLDHTSVFEFATKLMAESGPDVVARKILQIYTSKFDKGVVITGFRTIEELEVLKSNYPRAKLLYIEASERTRFQRMLERGRSPNCHTIEEFRKIDAQQWSFGLLRVAEDFAELRLVNEGTMDQFHTQIDAVLSETFDVAGVAISTSPGKMLEVNQLLRCLRALDNAGRPMSTDEIERETGTTGSRIRHNNANKVLKRAPELARRLMLSGTRVRYEITNAGRAYLRYMQKHRGLKFL
jgi:inosine/xanthosine triphosphate pyrophosphatase family protein/dephospho-CoA kinase